MRIIRTVKLSEFLATDMCFDVSGGFLAVGSTLGIIKVIIIMIKVNVV